MTTSAITFLRVVKVATENNSKLLHSLRGLLLTFGRDYKLNYTQGPAGPGEGQQAGQHWGGQESSWDGASILQCGQHTEVSSLPDL